jgi:hypothetical protein
MQQLSPAAKQKQVHAVQQLNNNTQLHQLDKHSMQAVAWWQVAAAAVVQWLRAVLHSHSGQHNTQLNERYRSSCACSTTQCTYGNALLLQNRGSSRYRLDTEK